MKKVLLLSIFSQLCFAQQITIPEPEFVGNVVYVSNNQPIELEKQKVSSRTSASAGLVLFGLGSVSSKLIIKGSKSPVRITDGYDLKFIIKVLDNVFDPFDKVELIKFSSEGNERRLKIASVGTFESPNSGDVYRVKFKAQKYGTSSYLVTVPSISEGEYAFNINIVSKENNSTGTSTFHLFSVDYEFEVGDTVEWMSRFGAFSTYNTSMGHITESNNNKITVVSKEGITKILDLNREEVRKVNPEKLKTNELTQTTWRIGDSVQFNDLSNAFSEKWFGTIIEINGNIANVNTSDKGIEIIKAINLNNLIKGDSKNSESQIDLSQYKPEILWGTIKVGDKVEAESKYRNSKWIGIYLGTKGNQAYIKTTNNGQTSIENFYYNINEINMKLIAVYQLEDTKKVVEAPKNDIIYEQKSTINIGDKVSWQDDSKKTWEGRIFEIADGIASINLLNNGTSITKKVKIEKLTKK